MRSLPAVNACGPFRIEAASSIPERKTIAGMRKSIHARRCRAGSARSATRVSPSLSIR